MWRALQTGNNHRSYSKDGGEGDVAEVHLDVCGVVVGDERQAVREHMVGGASVCNG